MSTCTIQEELLSPLKVDHMAFNYPSQGVNKSSESELNLSINNVTDETGHEKLSNIDNLNPHKILNNLRTKNANGIILSHLNINSIRNKIGMLLDLVTGKVDILLISETKIDASFPSPQFLIPAFTEPYRRDRSGFTEPYRRDRSGFTEPYRRDRSGFTEPYRRDRSGFTEPYRRDRSGFGGGLLLYVNDRIPSKLVFKSAAYNESLFVGNKPV